MRIITDTRLDRFEPWSGAKYTFNVLEQMGMLDTLEAELEQEYPDGIEDGELNDLLWFEEDYLAQLLGFDDWEALEKSAEEDEDSDEDEDSEEDEDIDESVKARELHESINRKRRNRK